MSGAVAAVVDRSRGQLRDRGAGRSSAEYDGTDTDVVSGHARRLARRSHCRGHWCRPPCGVVVPPGALLVVALRHARPGNWLNLPSTPVRPATVAAPIRRALAAGQPPRSCWRSPKSCVDPSVASVIGGYFDGRGCCFVVFSARCPSVSTGLRRARFRGAGGSAAYLRFGECVPKCDQGRLRVAPPHPAKNPRVAVPDNGMFGQPRADVHAWVLRGERLLYLVVSVVLAGRVGRSVLASAAARWPPRAHLGPPVRGSCNARRDVCSDPRRPGRRR